MDTDLNRRLTEARERLARQEKLQRLLNDQRRHHAALEQRLQELARQLRQEQDDVERLERPSLQALVASLLGNRDERLDQERQEAAAAQLKYAEAKARLEDLRQDIIATEAQLRELENAPRQYQELLAEKERLLMASGGERGRRLADLADREGQLRSEVREMDEALRAGEAARDALAEVTRSLESARNWGTWDVLGGGLIATAVKHSRLDDAQRAVGRAQYALDRFARELRDVQMQMQLQGPEVGGFLGFADYFFDGLLADLMVQSRIRGSLEQAGATLSRVEEALSHLWSRRGTVAQALAEVTAERRRLLEGMG